MLAGFTHEPVVQLSERLAQLAPAGLGHCFYASDGASAIEIALKMSVHYWRNRGQPHKSDFISLQNSYHGETLGALSVTDVALFKGAYGALVKQNATVPSPDWRNAEPGENARDYAVRCAAQLETHLQQHHPNIAAFIVEPLVQGAAGMVMYHPAYLTRARELCDRYDVHLIVDEIAVGMGRTGTMFACEQAEKSLSQDRAGKGISPDFLCLSKGLSGGYLPLSVVMTTDTIYQAFYADQVTRGFLHSHSYTGNPLACSAALATLEIFCIWANSEFLEVPLNQRRASQTQPPRESGNDGCIEVFMKLLHTLLLLFCFIPSAHAAKLPPPVVEALQLAHIPLDSIGMEVHEVNARTPLISVNAKQSMNPASTMKLLTTYAGLELLGPAYSWKTEAYIDGKLEQDVLHGDLILKGYGDPKLTLEKLWLWLHELRSRGLREIRGDLVLDRSEFQLAPHDPAEFDNEPMRPYNTEPDALLINFNSVRLRFIPEGEKIKIISMPELAGIRLDNRVTVATKQGNCSNWDDAISLQLQGDSLLVQGAFPVQCGERERHVSLLPPPDYMYALFRVLWQEMGGMLHGTLREGTVPGSAILFDTHHSAPLAELIRDINKFSNNVMARQLFLSLGRNAGIPANFTHSERAVRNWLTQKKLHFPELILENGAGLSRRERISPRSLSLLLQNAQRSPVSAEFEASLPIVGVDGTFKKRLTDSEAANHAHLKTGSLEGVRAIAGYVQSHSGKQWVLVFLINHPNAAAGQQAQNALIEWIQQRY